MQCQEDKKCVSLKALECVAQCLTQRRTAVRQQFGVIRSSTRKSPEDGSTEIHASTHGDVCHTFFNSLLACWPQLHRTSAGEDLGTVVPNDERCQSASLVDLRTACVPLSAERQLMECARTRHYKGLTSDKALAGLRHCVDAGSNKISAQEPLIVRL